MLEISAKQHFWGVVNMPHNFLEQLVAEWYEFQGYFVRRNIPVGKRAKGGYDGELDVVAFHPGLRRLVHVEPSMDAQSWKERKQKFTAKFKIGRETIPSLFEAFHPLPNLEQYALLAQSSAADRREIGGGRVMPVAELMTEIREEIGGRRILNSAIPEQFVILRALQFAANYWTN
jgi:hypothetical protein